MSKKKNLTNKQSSAKSNITPKSQEEKTQKSTFSKNHFIAAAAAVVITFLCFTTALNNEFVNWDDDRNFYENPLITTINSENFWDNTKQIFKSNVIGNYNPLTIWTFALEKRIFGLDSPFNWHLNNVLLHLICVLLVFRIGTFLGLRWLGAFILALLFGIHPMRVESVAWVTERKDVLFGVFYLGAMLQYIKFKIDGKSIRWAWITVLFILSLFSKIQAVSLPLSLIAIDYFMDKKWEFKSVLNKIPFFGLSLFFGIYGMMELKAFGSLSVVEDTTNFSFFQRLFVGAFSFLIYIVKWIFPFRMSPLYPYPNNFPWYFWPSILMAPITLFVLYKSYVTERKVIFFGLSFFIVNIVFLLQILGAGQGYLADRFTYIAYLGLFFIIAYYGEQAIQTKPQLKNVILGGGAVYLLVLGFITFQQNKIWKDSGTLWTHVLKYYKQTTLPYGNRANFYRDKGMYTEALRDYNATIAMKDQQPQAYNSRAKLFFTLAKGRDTLLMALNDYNKAIEYEPNDGEFHVNRGATYARLGDFEKAIENFNKGIELKPDHAVGYLNRSVIYNNMGNIPKALEDIDAYLKLNPYNADIWYEKGRALRLLERPQEAISAYEQAIKINKTNGLYYYEKSRTHAGLNQFNEAKREFQNALNVGYTQFDPAYKQQLGL
ncbi:MAG: tetratricopeptide repeat protein [Saprospiraceae bacterium]|nr:tetratricopeptide repeat protein [Saprospiraceae bacterium]